MEPEEEGARVAGTLTEPKCSACWCPESLHSDRDGACYCGKCEAYCELPRVP